VPQSHIGQRAFTYGVSFMTSTGPQSPHISKRSKMSRATQEDMLHACSFPEDLKSFEHAVQETINYLFGGVIYTCAY
jgi:hypothetical protein